MLLEQIYWCVARKIDDYETAVAPGNETMIRVHDINAEIIMSIRICLLSMWTHVCFFTLNLDY
jgi:hypothetical protein